jgi:TolB protein
MDGDGSGVSRLTRNPASDGPLSLSGDGSRVVFASTRDGDEHIYVTSADGTEVTRLTSGFDSDPVFSADGSQVAFVSFERDGNTGDDIYVMNADGSGVRRVTEGGGADPSFSPDGSRIVFISYRDVDVETGAFDSEIYVASVDGSEVMRLTISDVDESSPAYSPDGTQIAFVREGDVHVMNADGTGVRPLTADGTIAYVTWGGETPP